MTLDELLERVKPLLPITKNWDNTPVTLHCGVDRIAKDDIHADDWQALSDYAMHAANHLPDLVEALREALNDVKSFNLMARHTFKVHPFTRLESQLEQALAAVEQIDS